TRDQRTAETIKKLFDQTYLNNCKICVDYALPVTKANTTKTVKDTCVQKNKIPPKINANIFEIDVADKEEFEEFLRLNKVDPKLSRVTYIDKEKKSDQISEKEVDNQIAIKNAENEIELTESARLFVRNIPFDCNETELQKLFEKFGKVLQVYIPIDSTLCRPKGFAYITFESPSHAVEALNNLDGHSFKGRVIHIIPAKELPRLEGNDEITSYKTKKIIENKKNLGNQHPEWNSLFLGSKATANILCQKLNISKEHLLKGDEIPVTAAVRLAVGETDIVKETKKFLINNGVCLDAFNKVCEYFVKIP
ncbi:hypothetical protein HZS_1565, partial [Henneguya salminicola]